MKVSALRALPFVSMVTFITWTKFQLHLDQPEPPLTFSSPLIYLIPPCQQSHRLALHPFVIIPTYIMEGRVTSMVDDPFCDGDWVATECPTYGALL